MRSIIERTPFERCGVRWDFEAEFGERRARVFGKDRFRLAIGIQRESDRDQTAHQMGIAVAEEMKHRAPVGAGARFALDPDLADATAHLGRLVVRGFGQRFERLAEFEDVAVAIFPIVEKSEVLADGGDRGQDRSLERGCASPYSAQPRRA